MRIGTGAPVLLAILASCASPAAVDSAFAAPPGEQRPVIVELFSSEGCSSCPPADDVLRNLGATNGTKGIPGAEIIALELHVDYWNYLGWEDPFSNAAFTARQRDYATVFQQRGVYTPQMVIDGRTEIVGSRGDAAKSAIAAAAKAPKAKVTLARKGDVIDVAVGELPDKSEPLTVWMAITESGLTTPVPRGENAGATLAHAPIVRRLSKIGSIAEGTQGPSFRGSTVLSLDASWKRDNLSLAVFVQRDRSRHVVGASAIPLRK